MDQREIIVLEAFLAKASPDRRPQLVKFLPPSVQDKIDPNHLPDNEKGEEDLLEHIHWSWFTLPLKEHTEKEQISFLLALNGITQHNLAEELKIQVNKESISENARMFLREELLKKILNDQIDILPKQYLPPSSLNILLSLEKKAVISLIDSLSLYDLSHELRQIVETKILKKIYSFLSEEEKHSLREIANKKEPFSFSRMMLEKWDGKKESFRILLHKRGLARLGAALSGQHPDLVWHICHQLDRGRGAVLYKFYQPEPLPEISDWIVKEIETLLKTNS